MERPPGFYQLSFLEVLALPTNSGQRVDELPETCPLPGVRLKQHESDLYIPVAGALADGWARRESLRESIVEITAFQGRRQTGGFWTRPDVVVIGSKSHPYVPGRHMDLTTFEIKKSLDEAVQGVFEAAAHSVAAHRSVVLIQASPGDLFSEEEFARAKSESARLGVGLMTFRDAGDWGSYRVEVEAQGREPSPTALNRFIASQISEANRQQILSMFR